MEMTQKMKYMIEQRGFAETQFDDDPVRYTNWEPMQNGDCASIREGERLIDSLVSVCGYERGNMRIVAA
jgi:hypothetical protein